MFGFFILCGISCICSLFQNPTHRNMPAEPEPFDECVCSCMKGICARVRIFHSEYQRKLVMASSEPSTSRVPEEDSSDVHSDSDNEVSQIDFDSQFEFTFNSAVQ